MILYEKLLRKQMSELRPTFTCEWGSGDSTDIFLSYDCVKAHIVIESDPEAYKKLNRSRNRLFPYFVSDLSLYAGYARKISRDMNMEFKVMFINGEMRIECLREAKDVLHFYGAAVMTDAQLIKYMQTMNECFPKQEWDMPENESYTVALKTYNYGAKR